MSREPKQEGETPRSLVKVPDGDSKTRKPIFNMVEDVMEPQNKRKASTDMGPANKKQRGDGVIYISSTRSVVLVEVVSAKGVKWEADADQERPKKKSRRSSVIDITSSDLFEDFRERQLKRKAKTHLCSSDCSQRSRKSPSSSDDDLCGLSFSVESSKADFDSKYKELHQIGEGGFGSVMAGYRLKDSKPVAIKHIPKKKVRYREVVQNGKVHQIIDEVALMVKLAGGAESPNGSAAVALLDCYDLEDDLILVMERPVSAMDLYDYRNGKGGYLQEDEAKIFLKQMVDASIEMHTKGVFHRDIKLENILIETGGNVPRVRVIDFGCGSFVKKGYYRRFAGTMGKAPPEWFMVGKYKASPTTVWQLGAMLYDLLDHKSLFETEKLLYEDIEINSNLSTNCKDFLQLCLVEDPRRRASLEQLQLHPWLL